MIKYWPILLVIISSIMATYYYTENSKILRWIGLISGSFIFIGIICVFLFLNWKWGLISILLAVISYHSARH